MGYLKSDIVITGFSGRFPESENVEEFKKNLFESIDMVTSDDRRWPLGTMGLPERNGKLKDLESFDASYFGVHPKQANVMDPQLRLLLEITQEAIIDAGINPVELRGSNTGVFIGVGDSETWEYFSTNPNKINGYEKIGCYRGMFANRISYTFNFNGPSFVLDNGCSSSLYALHQAILAMRAGECDAAIVGGTTLDLKPINSLQFQRLNMLSPDGMCKAFDVDGKGYVRSEAVSVLFLQRAEDAKRIYASVINTKTNIDGYKVDGITFPSGDMQLKLLKAIYTEAKINPWEVSYFEAHGTGTKVGDLHEVNSIADFFCKNRSSPLLIGSVKSNMGHAESASGLCSLAKILISMESKALPGNLHFKTPNPNIPALFDGRLKVVDQTTAWNAGLVGVNSLGFGGTNAHAILKSFSKKRPSSIHIKIPKIVGVSGRTREACQLLLENANKHKQNDEFIGLIQNIYKKNITGYNYRGCSILNAETIQEIVLCETSSKRPIWFAFSGLGTEWPGCGKELMNIPAFAKSIEISSGYVEQFGLDLLNLINNSTETDSNDLIASFILIISIQVGLVDFLASLGVHPDGIIGLSIGELACAYADGALTQEQTILSAYWRGKSIKESNIIDGLMATVGLTWEETVKLCPKDIDAVCHISINATTIAGPKNSIKKFEKDLITKGIFVKIFNSANVPFHSRYITGAASNLQKKLDEIIPQPKLRSAKWYSSSVPASSWETDSDKYCDAKYFVNNLLMPVYFYEALRYIPDNAITIEIAPNWTLKTVMRKSLAPTTLNVALHMRDHPNNIEFALINLSKIFNAGVEIDFSKLYPPIEFPVSSGTPMLNSLVGWDHTQKWAVANFAKKIANNETVVEINLDEEEYRYLAGHCVGGRLLFPASGYIVLIWKTFAKMVGTHFEQLPVVIENIRFLKAIIIPRKGSVKLLINILQGTGYFSICEGKSLVVTGRIYLPECSEKCQLELSDFDENIPKGLNLTDEDLYKDLRLRGYEYSGIFQGIKSSNNGLSSGELYWKNNWVAFIDTIIQFYIIGKYSTKDLYVPTKLENLSIYPQKHLSMKNDTNVYKINYCSNLNILQSGWIELRGINLSLQVGKHQVEVTPKIENYLFIPYDNSNSLDVDPNKNQFHALTVLFQIIKENLQAIKMRGIEVCTDINYFIAPIVAEILMNETSINYSFGVVSSIPLDRYLSMLQQFDIELIKKDVSLSAVGQDLHFVIAQNVVSNKDPTILTNLIKSIKPEGFIITLETKPIDVTILDNFRLILVSKQMSFGKTLLLLTPRKEKIIPIEIFITGNNFSWLEQLKCALKKSETTGDKILLISQGEPELGLVGFINCIRMESEVGKNIYYVFIQDENTPAFNLENSFYTCQLEKQLISNVFKHNKWGSYRHLWVKDDEITMTTETNDAFVDILTRGDLSSLRWIEKPKNENNEVCKVFYAALNFRDIMLASGKLTQDALPQNMVNEGCNLGLEFSGTDSKGQRIIGMLSGKGLATKVLREKTKFLWEVPEKWSLKEAATIPVCYSTSYYALFVRGRLQPGESVLIHAGSGGVGLASISIALHLGCKVFTTVGTAEKREFLIKTFPKLTEKYIGNSRDTSFEQMIKSETNGEGVDVVLNLLAEEKLKASIRCLKQGGRFLEIGKLDLSNDSLLGMSVFLKNTSFHGIVLEVLFDDKFSTERQKVINLVSEGIINGAVKPLPSTVFDELQLEEAFKFMASGRHIGKVLLEICNEESSKITEFNSKRISAVSRTYFNPKKCYILIGGLGGFGMELAYWMISRGAKILIFTSRSGVKNGYQSVWIRRWKESGIFVSISTEDLITMDGCQKLIVEANKIAPVGGIFNLAGILYNDSFINLNEHLFSIVTRPKINVTKNLDVISRKLCPVLDYFVIFSSTVCGRGMPGQTNYGFANSAMERIVEKRREDGLAGLGIQWGTIGDVGMVVNMYGNNKTVIEGTSLQKINSCLNLMDIFLHGSNNFSSVISSIVLEHELKFKKKKNNQTGLVDVIGNILGIKDVKTVNQNSTFLNMGLDSLVTTEIKQTLERSFDIILSVSEIRCLTFTKLNEIENKD